VLKPRVKISDKDLGGFNRLKKLGKLQRNEDLLIGVFGEAGGDVVLRATVHEFGAPSQRIPERSFLRSTLDEKRADYVNQAGDAAGRIHDRVLKGADPVSASRREMGLLGQKITRDVRNKIRSNISPPLSAKTIAAKGSSVALIDTGRMIQAITYKIGKAPK
jgi:hypothetical protein